MGPCLSRGGAPPSAKAAPADVGAYEGRAPADGPERPAARRAADLAQATAGGRGAMAAHVRTEAPVRAEWCAREGGGGRAMRGRMRALVDAADAVLNDAADAANDTLAGSGWMYADVRRAVDAMADAVGEDADVVKTLLSTHAAVHDAAREDDAPAPPYPVSRGAERVVGVLGAIWLRTVTLSTPAELAARRRVWAAVRKRVFGGVPDEDIACALSANAKAVLCFVDASAVPSADADVESALLCAGLEDNLAFAGERRAAVRVRRGTASAAFADGLGAARAGAWWSEQGTRKVFPSFVDAETGVPEGGEGHGPRKEFFRLLGAAMVAAPDGSPGAPPLFVERDIAVTAAHDTQDEHPNVRCRALWYNAAAVQADARRLDEYAFVGYMCGQSLANKSPLGCRFDPWLLALALRDAGAGGPHVETPSLGALWLHDAETAAGIARIRTLSDGDFASMLELEELDPNLSREDFVRKHSVPDAMLHHEGAVGAARASFSRGIAAGIRPATLVRWGVSGRDLACMLYGGDATEAFASAGAVVHDNGLTFPLVQEAFQVALEDDLLEEEYGALVEALLVALDGCVLPGNGTRKDATAKHGTKDAASSPAEFRRGFMQFATACPSPPSPFQSELLTVSLAFTSRTARATWQALPTAHTCANAIEIPDYLGALRDGGASGAAVDGLFSADGAPSDWDAVVRMLSTHVRERLAVAMAFCGDYALDALEGNGGASRPAPAPVPRAAPAPRPPLLTGGAPLQAPPAALFGGSPRPSQVAAPSPAIEDDDAVVPFALPGALSDSCGAASSALWGPVLRSSPSRSSKEASSVPSSLPRRPAAAAQSVDGLLLDLGM